MSETLNFEIVKEDEVVANCYYRWSGFTGAALDYACEMSYRMDKIRQKYQDPYCIAIALLQVTGAKLLHSSAKALKDGKIIPSELLRLDDGEGEGLIGVSEEDKESISSIGDEVAIFNLDSNQFDISGCFDWLDKDDLESVSNRDREIITIDCCLAELKESDLNKVVIACNNALSTGALIKDESGNVYEIIW